MDLDALHQELISSPNLLIVQDLDGVCMPLVRDPLTRKLPADYVKAAATLRGSFSVLTNGEHEGRRGVNRLVEQGLDDPAEHSGMACTYRLAAGNSAARRIRSFVPPRGR